MKFNFIFILFVVFTPLFSSAQSDLYRTCATEEMWNKAVINDPQALVRRNNLHQNRISLPKPAKMVSVAGGTAIYRIPVVFHVMHTYGPENISKAQIEDAVRILNLSFQKLNPDTGDVIPLFQSIFGNPQIEFQLANIDPDGNCTDGITRTYTPLTAIADDNVKGLIDWPCSMYLNIWVVKNIASGAAGYAYYPGISSNIDGIVMRHDYTGSIGSSNSSNYTERSLTHEVGHWLNLPHTWGSSNTPGLASNCSIDDGIGDTPNTMGTGNFTCNTAQSTCGFIDNVQNYMDYASCHKMFTVGQCTEMDAALNSFTGDRISLWDPTNHSNTGTFQPTPITTCAPKADFNNQTITICQGATVNFKDVSWKGNVTSRTWTFNGGSPATDTSANPVVTYLTAGSYDVTLSVTNASGTDVLTRTAIIVVLPSPGTNLIPYSEGFETLTIPGNEWSIENPGTNNTWTINSSAAATGTKSVRIINHSGNYTSTDILLTPTYNLSNVTGTTFSFKVAYAPKSSSDVSTLKVFFTNDCGEVWSQRYLKTGSGLATAPSTSSSFVPNSTQWRTETVNLISSTFSGRPSVRAKFEFTNDQANNIYIDDIQISGTVGVNEVLLEKYNLTLTPNPSDKDVRVNFELSQNEQVHYELYDITGRKVVASIPSELSAGNNQLMIANNNGSGVFIFKLFVGEDAFFQRIVFL